MACFWPSETMVMNFVMSFPRGCYSTSLLFLDSEIEWFQTAGADDFYIGGSRGIPTGTPWCQTRRHWPRNRPHVGPLPISGDAGERSKGQSQMIFTPDRPFYPRLVNCENLTLVIILLASRTRGSYRSWEMGGNASHLSPKKKSIMYIIYSGY